MKRISKNKIEFDCIVRSINQTLEGPHSEPDRIEAFVNFFDSKDEINLVFRGNYTAKHLEKLTQAYKNQETITISIEVKDKQHDII